MTVNLSALDQRSQTCRLPAAYAGSSGLLRVKHEEDCVTWFWAFPGLWPEDRAVTWIYTPVCGDGCGDLWGLDDLGNLVVIECKRQGSVDPFTDFPGRPSDWMAGSVRRRWERGLKAELSFPSVSMTPASTERIIRFAEIRDDLRPLPILAGDPPEPIAVRWAAISVAGQGGGRRFLVYLLGGSGQILEAQQWETMRIALDQARSILGLTDSQWLNCDVSLSEGGKIDPQLLHGEGAPVPTPKRVKSETDAVRAILTAWDPIAGGLCPADEYDCLVDQIVGRLHRGANEKALREFIVSEFADHFGMSVACSDASRVSTQILAWWEQSPRSS